MEEKNLTWQNYFIIGGITDLPQLQAPIFFLVLFIYVTVLSANSTILLLICRNQQLHTPMYYFLSHLSIIDMCYSTVTMHKTLDVYVSKNKQISFSACLTQMYFYVTFLCCEFLILTAMSYDRYVAICIPLRYVMIMNKKLCAILTILCWIVAFLEVLPSVFIIYHIYCFKSNYINLFFCDLMSIMKLFCHGASLMEHLIYAESAFVGFLPFSFIIASYSYIIRAIFKISSSSGRWKAFYTCSSHITVVALLIVPTLCLYVRPTSAFALDSDKIFLLFYTSLTPLVNPLIYSLKNKDVKMAFWQLVEKKKKILV